MGRWGADGALPTAEGAAPHTLGAISPPAAAPTPPNLRRGRTSAHPRRKTPRPQQPQAQAIATKGAPQRTLDTNYSAQQLQPATQPPPRVQSHAPSMPITPPTTAPTPPNHRRGSTTVHPQQQLPHSKRSLIKATVTEGAPQHTLDADYQAHQPQPATQPTPKEHQRASSMPITPSHDTSGGSNRLRGSNAAHHRRSSPRPQQPQASPTITEGAPQRTLSANHPVHDRNPQG